MAQPTVGLAALQGEGPLPGHSAGDHNQLVVTLRGVSLRPAARLGLGERVQQLPRRYRLGRLRAPPLIFDLSDTCV